MKKSILIVLFLLFSTCSYAWITDIGIDPLDQNSGAKPLSLGGAFAGASGDINCIFYNPAGLANSQGIILSVHDDKTFSVGIAYETGVGHFGVAVVNKSHEGIRLNDTLKVNYTQNIALLSYGIGSDNVSLGFAVKGILSQQLSVPGVRDMSSNSGIDYDAGILWEPIKYASIGAMIRNGSGTTFTFGSSEEAFPKLTRIGFVLNLLGKNSVFYNDEFGLKAAYDVESGIIGDDQKHNSFYGIEGSFEDRFFVRFGGNSIFNVDSDVAGLSGGLGIKFGDAEVDMTSLKDPLTETQISYLSLSYSPREFALFKAPEVVKPEVVKPEVVEPEEAPSDLLKLVFPKDGLVTYNEYVVISGETRPKANVLINGVRADVDSYGKFAAVQSLISGKNLIRVTVSLNSETKTVFRKILKKAKVIIEEEVEIDKRIDQEVLKRGADITREEEKLRKEKKKGIDVSRREKLLAEEKAKQQEIQAKLLKMKKTVEERKEKVENLVTLGVIEVSPETKFKIESPITRGEMISWLVRGSGLALPRVEKPVFIDVPKNHRFAAAIKAALDAGRISALPGGKFRPDDPVKEEEGEAFFRAFGIVK